MNLKYKYSACIVLLAFCSQVIGADMPTQFQGDETSNAHCTRLKENIVMSRQDRITDYIPKPANEAFSTGTCLDQLLRTRVNIWTIPSLDGVMDQVMQAAQNKVCGMVMSAWNQVINEANQALGTSVSVPYLGQVANVGVGQGTGGSPIVVNGGQGFSTPATQPFNGQQSAGGTATNNNATRPVGVFGQTQNRQTGGMSNILNRVFR